METRFNSGNTRATTGPSIRRKNTTITLISAYCWNARGIVYEKYALKINSTNRRISYVFYYSGFGFTRTKPKKSSRWHFTFAASGIRFYFTDRIRLIFESFLPQNIVFLPLTSVVRVVDDPGRLVEFCAFTRIRTAVSGSLVRLTRQ